MASPRRSDRASGSRRVAPRPAGAVRPPTGGGWPALKLDGDLCPARFLPLTAGARRGTLRLAHAAAIRARSLRPPTAASVGRCPRLLLCVAALLFGASASAQTGLGGERDTVAVAPGQTAVRLPQGVIPGSLGVEALRGQAFEALESGAFSVDDAAGVLRLAAPADSVVVLRLAYRRLAALPAAERPLPRLDSLLAQEARTRAAVGGDSVRAGPSGPSFSASGLRTTGSITRGVVAGTSRDVSVTSGLRLDVSGEVAPGVRLRAALTDENTPILPEGTTTQLSDLDRVFVEVESPRRARAPG